MLDSDVIKPFNSPWTTGSDGKEIKKRWNNEILHRLSKFKPSHERRCLPLAWCDKKIKRHVGSSILYHLDLVRGLLGSGCSQLKNQERRRRFSAPEGHSQFRSKNAFRTNKYPQRLFCRQWIQSLTNWTGKTASCIWTKFCIRKEFGWTQLPISRLFMHSVSKTLEWN